MSRATATHAPTHTPHYPWQHQEVAISDSHPRPPPPRPIRAGDSKRSSKLEPSSQTNSVRSKSCDHLDDICESSALEENKTCSRLSLSAQRLTACQAKRKKNFMDRCVNKVRLFVRK